MREFTLLTLILAVGSTSVWGQSSEWKPWPGGKLQQKTDEELRDQGRSRAEAEYDSGWGEIEIFGLWAGSVYIDEETGLYLRLRGCVIMDRANVESDSYNERIRELVADKGLPKRAKDLKERFQELQGLLKKNPQFAWVQIPWTRARPLPTKVGPLELHVEVVRNPFGDDGVQDVRDAGVKLPASVSRVRILRGRLDLVTVRVEEGQTLAATLLPELEILVLKKTGRGDVLYFIDLRHGRIMWLYPGIRDFLQEMKPRSQTSSTATQRSYTPCV